MNASVAKLGIVLFVLFGAAGTFLMLGLHGVVKGPDHKAIVHVAPALLMLSGLFLMMWEEQRQG